MQSLRGKATSEWSVWILTYEHALRRKFDASYATTLKLDYKALREKAERGDNPIELVNDGFVPIISDKAKAVAAIEHRRVLASLEQMKTDRITKSWVRACVLISAVIVVIVGFMAYSNWESVQQAKSADQAHAEWRQNIGLDH